MKISLIKLSSTVVAISSVCGLLLMYRIYSHDNWRTGFSDNRRHHALRKIHAETERVHVVVSVCGDRLGDLTVALKSLVMTSKGPVTLHAFIQPSLLRKLRNAINILPEKISRKLELHIRDLFWPNRTISGFPPSFWKQNFNGCPYQRLFLSEALPGIDRVIYVDADTVFLAPVEDLWAEFARFTTNQLAGLAEEQLGDGRSFYDNANNRRHPIYGRKGLNSGVILLDLRKIQASNFLGDIGNITVKYNSSLRLFEQGHYNTYFHFHPERMYRISCVWNYRTDFCEKLMTCKEAEDHGVCLLHGNRKVFHLNTPFRVVHAAFRDVRLQNFTNPVLELMPRLQAGVDGLKRAAGLQSAGCRSLPEIYTAQLKRQLENVTMATVT